MAREFMLQLAFLILTLSILYVVHNLRKRPPQLRFRNRTRDNHQSNRHLVQGSRLLARARSISQRPQTMAHARNAIIEADQALSLSPRDPAAHILKALALDLMGHRTAALSVKRAELKLAVNRRRRVDSAVEDLVEAVRLSEGRNTAALCSLGECYEWKEMKEKAKEAFQRALDLEPESVKAHNGLDRLGP
ncbi:uncharacterized protein LOC129295501 [Prosopis cineraria]|uniref:uncharacterized protein LOC129295501 n=1 Tax=Prosopis cineraria TaxID=364024 RepID=UPI0024100D0A|nr:uncharacterized protein LOC129295501 [Prosopis cineraria]